MGRPHLNRHGAAGGRRSVAGRAVVVAARVALALGDFAAAGTLVAGLPTAFSYVHTFSLTTSDNTWWGLGLSSCRYSVGDSVEGNAHDRHVDAADGRGCC